MGTGRPSAWPLAVCCLLAATAVANHSHASVVVSCGFEATGDTWSYAATGGGAINANMGDSDSPAKQRVLAGSRSWLVSGATSTLTFSEVLLSGWTSAIVRYHVSSTAASTTVGHSSTDSVAAYVGMSEYGSQIAPAFGDVADVTLTGWGNATWGYNSGAPQKICGASQQVVLNPAGSGLRTTDGYTDFAIQIPSGKRSVAFKLSANNDALSKRWNLDNVAIEATATASNNRWWDGDGHDTVGGGTGTWDNAAATTRWASDDNKHFSWNDTNGDNAFFGQTKGDVTIAAGTTVAARSLTFNSNGYMLAAGDSSSRLVLTNGGSGDPGASTIDVVGAGDKATINATIACNPGVGLTKTGEGTLVLQGVNACTGDTTIRAGTLDVSAGYSLGAVGAKVVLDGGTLRLAAAVDLKGDHPLMVESGGGAIDTQGNTCSASTVGWSGDGRLTKLGAGTLRLEGATSAFTGAIDVQQGTLHIGSDVLLNGCSSITVRSGATLDATAAAGFHLGAACNQRLQGAGTIVGDLQIDCSGTHDVGNSPETQQVQGNYTMNGVLRVEVQGNAPGDGTTGYDQVLIGGGSLFNVSLNGELSLVWNAGTWSPAGDKLWIIRNNTAGALSGTFNNYHNGDLIGTHDDRQWFIYYAADAGAGAITGGNDVLLMSVASVPEPGSLALLLILSLIALPVLKTWQAHSEVVKKPGLAPSQQAY